MSNNPFDTSDDDENETGADGGTGAESQNMADLRKYAKSLEKKYGQAEKEVARLSEFESTVLGERREQAVQGAFTEVGLNPKHAELFKRLNTEGEVTVDAVKAFAAQYELATVQGEQVENPPAAPPAGFTPVTAGSPAPLAKMSMDDVNKLLSDGQLAAVQEAFTKGLVEKESAPWNTGRP